ncbi:hypothetical protein Y88_0678 [Novosphingobium nitrogenifigens DSM 19370]|uniref:Uncharacterized protein n=1 Tax=Novosphingobium nitrogenifigens DSM 19370 TaxID=983920 RepID=F1Z9X1_9SPHN|nr:hypothetical protein Y88_0678 [Novosphingobium nitrogenifigens DSM 19370]
MAVHGIPLHPFGADLAMRPARPGLFRRTAQCANAPASSQQCGGQLSSDSSGGSQNQRCLLGVPIHVRHPFPSDDGGWDRSTKSTKTVDRINGFG